MTTDRLFKPGDLVVAQLLDDNDYMVLWKEPPGQDPNGISSFMNSKQLGDIDDPDAVGMVLSYHTTFDHGTNLITGKCSTYVRVLIGTYVGWTWSRNLQRANWRPSWRKNR